MNVPGGLPPQRPDQLVQPISRAGTGPAPQTNVFSRIIVVTGGTGGIFLYSPSAGPGNLIGSWTAVAGTDTYGNTYPKGINVTSGTLSDVIVAAQQLTVGPGPSFFDAPQGTVYAVFTTAGVNNWVAPAGITSVQAICTGAGGAGGTGHASGDGGGGGGGGEVAQELTLAVTPGNTYHPTIGAPGSNTTFAGDSVTVTAHPGQNGTNGGASSIGIGGLGGTGSTNSVHFNGGTGGNSNPQANSGGGGGGGSAVNYQAGNPGMTSDAAGDGGVGGAALSSIPAQSGAGGRGGVHAVGVGANGSAPGGGGGGGGDGGNAGGTGANGQVLLIYSTGAQRTNVAIVPGTSNVTDPASGDTFAPGITSFDPAFGDSVRLSGNQLVLGVAANLQINFGGIDFVSLGTGLLFAEGANARQGRVTLAAGTSGAIANTTITASTHIWLSRETAGAGALGDLSSTRVAGTSFTINSSAGTDVSTVSWLLTEPG